MSVKSRTEYSARNTTVALVSRMAANIMGYVLRIVFTHTLSESYVGINGLFLDIIQVLALSELGVGTAITYALYKPIAENNIEKQKSLMQLIAKIYRFIALLVAVAGVALIPFLGVIIKDYQAVDNLILIYILYLSNTICSYLLIYKKTLIDAHQLNYIGMLYQTISWIVQDALQIVVLLLTKNFILYLCVNIFMTMMANLGISRKAYQLYPYLKEKNIVPLTKGERKDIFKNIYAMLMHKVGDVVVNNTDNIILSAYVGLLSVGCYSNYYLVIESVKQVLDQTFQGIAASVGNLGVTENKERVRNVFEATSFFGQWVYGFAAICLFELINPFVELSFGKKFLFEQSVVLILCINFFLKGMRRACLIFRDSLGLFWFDRYKAIAESVINIITSVILVKFFGTLGVFLGTLISMLTTSMWIEPYVLYKHHIKVSPIGYFFRCGIYVVVMAGAWGITHWVCATINGGLVQVIILRLLICMVVPNLLLLLVYFRTKEFAYLMTKAKSVLAKVLPKKS